jgi:prevent-host-death family protein
MLTIGINQFQENVMSFLKKVEAGESITITSQGHRIACVVPCEDRMEKARETLRQLRKNAVIGDIVSPLEEEWEAMK